MLGPSLCIQKKMRVPPGGSLLPVFWSQSFGDVSPYVCSYYFLV